MKPTTTQDNPTGSGLTESLKSPEYPVQQELCIVPKHHVVDFLAEY